MTTNETSTGESQAVQRAIDALNVDARGVARIEDLRGTRLGQAALDLLPSCRSIVVLGMAIYPEFLDLTTAERLAEAPELRDLYDQHKSYLRNRLIAAAYEVAEAARGEGFEALPFSAAGLSTKSGKLTSVIGFKEAAQAAGLGDAGMSGLLISREHGPRLMLNVCLTEAAAASTAREDAGGCRYCNICLFRCPSKAIGYPDRKQGEAFNVNGAACAAHVAAAGGCTVCTRVCPVGSPKYN